ncbi:histidine phosphatase family protein [Gordonia phthalatica]|nr:histidine phosphatase family protein [Gordonia phthalatica]
MRILKNRLPAVIAALLSVVAMLLTGTATAVAAPATGEMFVTFVRHGESAGNTSGMIDTSIPGPSLTAKGQAQAAAVASLLADRKFDGIYASRMVRTQQTAQPTSALRGLPIIVEPGFHEIEAGIYEGTPEKDALRGYLAAPLQWMKGDLSARTPGAENGYEFKKRVDDSLKDAQKRGSKRPVIFSHGGTIMFWTFISVSNPDPSKMQSDPLQNTGRVVVKGSPQKGWKLIEWNGKPAA